LAVEEKLSFRREEISSLKVDVEAQSHLTAKDSLLFICNRSRELVVEMEHNS